MIDTNFYKYAGINQNLNFDKIYPSRLEMEIAQNKINGTIKDDNVFPKRLVIINYSLKPSNWDDEQMPSWGYPNNEQGYFKYNSYRDKSYYENSYDSTVWQKTRGKLKSFNWTTETWTPTNEEGWIYQQVADLDSITIEVDTLNFPSGTGEQGVLIGVGSEGTGIPTRFDTSSFLDLEYSDDGKSFILNHESNFTDETIPTSTSNKLNFRDFSIDKAHVINSKALSLQAEDDIILSSTNTKDYKISHKNSTINTTHTINNLFDVTNKKIFIDEPGFDIHGHLESKGSKAFSFSIIGDEDIILSNYADNEIILSHKEATFSTTAIAPIWEEKSLYIPQLTFDKWGHINLNTNDFLQIKFQSDGTYIENENLTYGIKFNHKTYVEGSSLASISADVDTGVFTFKIPNVKRDSGGHISTLDALEMSIQVDNDILKIQTVNGKYEIYHRDTVSDVSYATYTRKATSAMTDNIAELHLSALKFDSQGHYINNNAYTTYKFIGDNNLNIYYRDSDSASYPKELKFEHYGYDEDLEEDLIDKNVNLTNNQIVELTSYIDEYGDPAYNYYYKCQITVELKENASLIIYFNDTSDGYINLSTESNGIGEHTITIYTPDKSFENEWWVSIYNESDADSYSIVSVIGYDQPVKNTISLPNFSFNNAGHYRKNNNENVLNFSLNQFKAFSFDNDNNEWLIELDPEKIINFNYATSQGNFQNELCIKENVWGIGDVPHNLLTPYYSNGVLLGIKKSSNWKEQIALDPQYIGSFRLGENNINIIQNILDSTDEVIGTRDPYNANAFIELSSSDIIINENMPLYEIIKLLTYKIYKLEQEIFNS